MRAPQPAELLDQGPIDANIEEFRTAPDGAWDEDRVLNFVASLDSAGRLVEVISDESVLNRQQAETLARFALKREPVFVLRLTKSLLENGMQMAPARIIRVLDVLSKVADISRLYPLLARLASHQNTFVRSKVSLVLGKSHANSTWIRKQFESEDPRTRANAIESGWGLADKEYRRICHAAEKDENNRVQGNALVGLYRCSDENWADKIIAMAGHPTESFRTTAIWAMGITGDLRFIPVLQSLVAAGAGPIRWHAMRAISRIRKAQD
jgi:HEAT repeat protein